MFFQNTNLFKSNKTKMLLVGILVLLAVLVATVLLVRRQQENKVGAAGVALSLVSATTTVQRNDTFTVDVYMDTKTYSVTGADIRVKFNTSLLQATGISSGNFLPTVFVPGQISGDTATIVLGSLTDQSGTYPKTGQGIVARVTFRSINSGTANISFGSATAVSAIGQGSNVAELASSINITVAGASGTAVPTGNRTPSPVPTGSTAPSTGDINGDGIVNIVDIGILIDVYGIVPVADQKTDLNHDGIINIVDIGIIIDNYTR
jgi:hypothetical protein